MTLREIEDKQFEVSMYIADKFRDIQMQANSLKSVEDEVKVKSTITKIVDFCEEVRRGYAELESLSMEDPVEETDNNNGFGSFF
mgnify:CR=1 FL=1